MLTCNRNKIIVKKIINKIDQTYRTINLYKIYFEIVKFENNLTLKIIPYFFPINKSLIKIFIEF